MLTPDDRHAEAGSIKNGIKRAHAIETSQVIGNLEPP